MDELVKWFPNLRFTVENKEGILHKIKPFNFKLSMAKMHYLKKYVFHSEEWNFEHIWSSVHTESLTLGKVLNIYVDYFMFDPSRQHMKWKMKALQAQVYIQQLFHDQGGAKIM